MPITFYLNLATLFFYLPFGFAFGIIAALKKDTIVDNIMQIVLMLFLSVPSLVFILLLIILFSYQLNGFLPSRFPLIALEGFWEIARGFVIPVIAGGLPAIAGLTRLLRAELSEVLTSEFVLLAKTKGLSHTQAVLRHAIRNSLVPMVPIIIGSFAALLGGSFIMERVYGIPGVGRVTLDALATGNYDYNVIMASSAFYGIIGLTTVLIVDLTYGIIDPQIRMGAKK
jgi:oligopeptide transport system permease protein